MTYEQAREDYEYLSQIYDEAEDHGFVYEEGCRRLLDKPTKATARQVYEDLIFHWFQNGPDTLGDKGHWIGDPEVEAICERHNLTAFMERLLSCRESRYDTLL